MAEQVQELIDKIKSEGVEAANQQARDIEAQAKQKAQAIIDQAKSKSDQLVVDAKESIKKLQESTQMALKQASRDTLLSLRKEIGHMLQKLVVVDVKDSLNAENLANIIITVIKETLSGKNSNANIEVIVSLDDLKKLEQSYVAKLKKQIKEPITFKASDEIGSGFTISFDGGKSSFDFTDEALASYLSTFLNSQVSALVNESVK